MDGTVNLTLFSLLAADISPTSLTPFSESHDNIIVEFFFSYLSKLECKKCICGTLPFTVVYPTMMIFDAEKSKNVKRVYYTLII